jgi:NAD(P)-dependent dehydrogenase (short-subunit alcohol dehydrogenase family)
MTQTSKKLAGKVALVTGASRGIAQRFAAEGATVVVSARSLEQTACLPDTLAETVELIRCSGGQAIPLVADLELPDQSGRRTAALERFTHTY